MAEAQTASSAQTTTIAQADSSAPAATSAAPAPSSAAPAAKSGGRSTQVQEVVVTAERRTTNLQQTPIAATVLTQDDLQKRGVFTVDQLQFVSPSLTVNNFGQGNDIDIRGIGKGEHNTQTGTGVVTYRDGVASFPGYFQEEPYYDISSIEVLRGPQGTFSGQNATGGAVIVNTQDPKINGGPDGYLLAHYGNYNDTQLQGAVNIPISDTLAARIAFNGQYRDSFYNINGLTGNPDTIWGSTRFSLLWHPNEALKVVFKAEYNYLDNGGYFGDALVAPTGGANPTNSLFKFNNNFETYAVDQFARADLKIDYVLPDGITLRSVTGYQQGRTGWKGDIDGTNAPPPNNFIIAEAVDERVWSQEFNIISPNKGPVTWILGAFYQSNNYVFPSGKFDIGVPPGEVDEDLQGTNPTQTQAVFGQLSFALPANFQLQVGIRYSSWSTTNHTLYYVPEFDLNFPQNQTESGSNVTGKVTLNWNLDPNNFLYAFVATGAKPGGLNTALYFDNGIIPAPFKQERVTDYEIGWKSKFLNNHLRTQLGAYYNNFENFQVILPLPDNPLQSTEVNNPSGTKLYGVEASAQAVFGDFKSSFGLGLEHTALGAFYAEDPRLPESGTCDPQNGPANGVCLNLKGKPQTYAPDATFNVMGQYDFHLANGDLITPNVNFSYVSSQWGTLFDNAAAGDYLASRKILGASLAWTHGSFVTTLYGYNLTNDQYVSALLSPIRLAGAPRQFGISVLKTF
ncbi:MAG: TonB-dependent receptor [Caulobacteraceae bacterium]